MFFFFFFFPVPKKSKGHLEVGEAVGRLRRLLARGARALPGHPHASTGRPRAPGAGGGHQTGGGRAGVGQWQHQELGGRAGGWNIESSVDCLENVYILVDENL